MKRNIIRSTGVGLLIGTALVVMPAHLWAFESQPVLEGHTCSGPKVGTVNQQSLLGYVLTLWKIIDGAPNTIYNVLYVCSPGPCNNNCGSQQAGTITTDASGRASKFAILLNPFPGRDMYWLFCVSSSGCSSTSALLSGIFTSPFSPEESEAVPDRDPAVKR